MSLIKESYSKINFPLSSDISKDVFNIYLSEFGFSTNLDLRKIIILFANALHDYLEGKLYIRDFASFSFFLYTSPGVAEVLKNEHTPLKGKLEDCFDIEWLANSPYFTVFKYELMAELEALKLFYIQEFER